MKNFIALFSLLIFSHNISAQISTPEIETFVKRGIDPYFVTSQDTFTTHGPKCITRNLLQDSKGDYWLATWQGIIKYDGKIFTNYTLKEGLIHFHVASCYEDKKGNLWFGTVRGGLYRYNGKSFTLFTINDGLADNTVSAFAEDEYGNIWLGTDKGACRYDGKTFTTFTTKNGLQNNHVSSIVRDKTGRLLFGCQSSTFVSGDGGICYYDGKSFKNLIAKDSLARNGVVSLLEDKNGNLWIGTFNGLMQYDGKNLKKVTELLSYLTYYIIEDKNGTLWFTGGEPNPFYSNIAMQSLYSYDGKSFTKVIEKSKPGDNQLFGKIADKNGNILFGTLQGIFRYDGKTLSDFTTN